MKLICDILKRIAQMVPGTATLKVDGMSCENCAKSVQKALEKTEGVFSADVSLEEGTAKVTYDTAAMAQSGLIAAVESVGYGAEAE